MRLLIDMDGVLADFEQGFLNRWRELYPERPFVSLAERNSFYLTEQYSTEYRQDIWTIINAPGFFRDLPVMTGCIAALNEMESLGIDPLICTTPLRQYQHCVLEKYEWVDEHLGPDWTKRIILTTDKTVVDGTFLIDDKVNIKGRRSPYWEHLIYDWPQNRYETDKRRLTWANWKEVLWG